MWISKKRFKKIEESIFRLEKSITDDYKNQYQRLNEIVNELSYVKIKVEKTINTVDDYGNTALKIFYTLEPVTLTSDDSGEILKNDIFCAINDLNLIDIDDQIKLANEIKKYWRQ